MLALAAALALAVASARAQTTTAVCSYAEWSYNSKGDSACKVWAQLQDICVPGTTVGRVTNVTAPYPPPRDTTANECNCNVVAYNLMAACSWCQPGIFTSDWVEEDEWEDRCSSYTSTGLPESVETRLGSIVIPGWAELSVRGTTWSPRQAEDFAETGGSGSATGGTPSSSKTSSAIGPIDTDWADDGPHPGDDDWADDGPWSGGDDCVGCWHEHVDTKKLAAVLGGILGVFVGLPLLGMLIGLIVYCVRQGNRKKFYGPLAEYYRNGGAPPAGLPMRGAPPMAGAYYPAAPYGQQQPYYPAGPSTVGSPPTAPTSDGSPRPQSFAQPGSPPQAYATPGQPPAQQPQVYQMPWSPVQQQPQPEFPQASAGGGSPPPAPPPGAYVHQPQPGVPMV